MAAALLHSSANAVLDSDARGRSALHYAAAAGNTALIELLLQRGADPSAQDELGRTAAHIAAVHEQPAFHHLSAESDLRDVDGHTAADIAHLKRTPLFPRPADR